AGGLPDGTAGLRLSGRSFRVDLCPDSFPVGHHVIPGNAEPELIGLGLLHPAEERGDVGAGGGLEGQPDEVSAGEDSILLGAAEIGHQLGGGALSAFLEPWVAGSEGPLTTCTAAL